jgi:hypothetical protein
MGLRRSQPQSCRRGCVVLATGKRSRFFWRKFRWVASETPTGDGRLAALAGLSTPALLGAKQFDVIDAKGKRQLVKSNNCWVSMALFEAADVLLAETRDFGELLLC